jgi:hypothetical protein
MCGRFTRMFQVTDGMTKSNKNIGKAVSIYAKDEGGDERVKVSNYFDDD